MVRSNAPLSLKIVLIGGANSDIGLRKPYHILFAAGSLGKAQSAVDDLKKEVPKFKNMIETLEVNLCNLRCRIYQRKMSSSRMLQQCPQYLPLVFSQAFQQSTKSLNNTFQLLHNQLVGKEIEFETNEYRCSKTALHMLVMDWNHNFADGVKVWANGPGMCATNLEDWTGVCL
ncbi:hypothetical protein SS1G_12989 [Sclerotinia sclerotiorum 1980 UF-70]|uniref:Uncharacterized protein n=1 Tax=Sclerotinia sclerotiorum (strain ATCC 18683 / 1980 / Ss-1) TaxID=665079 RepID=A7F5W1_SCLS1|nr:hypothetical protein SS1G_12989 [Sclerotinia sclerotiorum 1980 UF-70]EDN98132.1 hypothetical protein SS1G_12989 [Sclerotinia sclerotiorum 1980 UF-70]